LEMAVVVRQQTAPLSFSAEDAIFNPVDPTKKEEEFRNYKNGPRQKRVSNLYQLNHGNQTLDFVLGVKSRMKFDQKRMTLWEAFECLNAVIDDSDPDTNFTQLYHGLQTAEALRKEFPNEDWLHLTGLIHDLGKVLCDPCFGLEQWAIVGDTFPVGVRFSDKIVFHEFFEPNPDSKHPVYSSEYGIYEKNCGLMNLHMSFGHDEYLYQVLLHNKCTLPIQSLFIIRFHSFYPWHKEGAYQQLANQFDEEMYPWVKAFNKCDLYSKSHDPPKLEELKDYYQSLIDKYIPGVLSW